MLKPIIISLTICLCLIAQGQVLIFNSMDAKKIDSGIRTACADSSGNIYIGGDFTKIDTIPYWGIAKWSGSQWDSLGSAMHFQGSGGSYSTRALAFYKNHIYAGGAFTNMQGKPIRYIAMWNGTNWDSLPQSPNATVTKLIQFQGKLYAMGAFNKIGTTNCTKMAVWDGIIWSPISMPFTNYGLSDAVIYNGELYVGGNLFNGVNPGGLVKFDGAAWSVVGQGIKGSSAWVHTLKVFNNELYIGGYFEKGAGNPGENLMKWDGINYKEVITGLDGQVDNLTEVPDGLIASGCFSHPYNYVLKICNNGICGYNAIFSNCVIGSVYANNKLYFYGTIATVNGDSALGYINNVNYTTQSDSCTAFINAIEEINNANIKIYPNPTTSIINIVDENNQLQNSTIQIQNYFGQLIFTSAFTSQIDLRSLSAGIYFLTLENKGLKRTVKIVKD